jgi:hypothetical protein
MLPEVQRTFTETVKKLCRKHHFELRIIDVAKENILHRAIQQEIEKIKTFPTLMSDSGRRLEGKILGKQIESLLLGKNELADKPKT